MALIPSTGLWIKLRNSLEMNQFSAIQSSISLFSLIFILMHHIISWGQSFIQDKSLQPFTRKRSTQLKSGIQPLRETENCYQLLKPSRKYNNMLFAQSHGETFPHLPGKKNVNTVADALCHLDMDSMKIQENKEEGLTIKLIHDMEYVKTTILS
jgi:hypothetical protein